MIDPNGEYTIVGGSPSIETLDLEEYRVGTVVCINRAWYRFMDECDVWAVFERDAMEMWNSMPDPGAKLNDNRRTSRRLILEHRPQIVVASIAWKYWDLFLRSSGAGRKTYENLVIGSPTKRSRMPDGSAMPESVNWRAGSTISALGYLLTNGAKRVRVVGSEMRGVGGYKYEAKEDGSEYKEGPRGVTLTRGYPRGWWEKRWKREHNEMKNAAAVCADLGVEFERIDRIPDESSAEECAYA